jgi:hypothetical protein
MIRRGRWLAIGVVVAAAAGVWFGVLLFGAVAG